MSSDFFDKPFNEDTNVKLDLYREYLKKWFPVFLAPPNPFRKKLNVFDYFCGPGKDSEDTFGSPLIAIEVLNSYKDLVESTIVEINLHFNDSNPKYIEELKHNIEKLEFNRKKINIEFYNQDFVKLFPETLGIFDNSANLIFLDQFGIKYVDNETFQTLIKLKVTDILFFTSSSTFNRFPDDPNVTKIIGLSSDEIKAKQFYDIHRLVHQKYSDLIPEGYSYCLAPFSIKKGTNIYGLIFGSGHPLGMEKFLDICWEKDEETGEANFDIQGDKQLKVQPSLFNEDNDQTKKAVFQNKLKEKILLGDLKNDLEIFVYSINNGFTAKHIRPVIRELKNSGKINMKHPSFKCSTVWSYNREPKKVELF
ncbi:MAG: three-Cys-motif partner protein TcmP [Ignavibacteriae bacterium]|jgi:three-Cys-motif partner protein|nr:three-Cys-motif partner protein TcmP [Ignavibacteriota bacterium]